MGGRFEIQQAAKFQNFDFEISLSQSYDIKQQSLKISFDLVFGMPIYVRMSRRRRNPIFAVQISRILPKVLLSSIFRTAGGGVSGR